VNKEKAYPLLTEQIVREARNGSTKYKSKKKTKVKRKKQKKDEEQKKPGRKKGSKNQNKRDVVLTPFLEFVQNALNKVNKLINKDIDIAYFVYDGAFGNNKATQMVKRCDLDIISKLRRDSALEFPFTGTQNKRGAPKQYASKIDYSNIPIQYLVSTTVSLKSNITTKIYQMEMLHRTFSDTLNVVIIQKIYHKTNRIANINLFTTDLHLSYDKIIKYYSLRFQIEFIFRDAKQHWGLEDFMNTKEKPIHNWANLSISMVNVGHSLMKDKEMKGRSILDLKALYHGQKYIDEFIKLLPKLEGIKLIKQSFWRITNLGAIHPVDLAS
jgi:hypothetical protein